MPLESLSGPKAQHVAWLALGITVDLTGPSSSYLCLLRPCPGHHTCPTPLGKERTRGGPWEG